MNAIDDIEVGVSHPDAIDTISPGSMIPNLDFEEERQRLLSESAKLRAAARRQYKTFCRECGKELIGLSRKKFCGQTHQRAHWRRRLASMNPGDPLPPVE